MTIVLDPNCTGYHQPGHPEKPNRVARTVDLLRLQKPIALEWATPAAVTDAVLLRGHTPEHLARLKVEAAFDADTPWHPGIEDHARRSVGAALRAMEMKAEVILKGTKVDGIYTADPKKDPKATRYERLTFAEAIEKQLAVMDLTALTMCMEHELPVVVFDFRKKGNIQRVLEGDSSVGTVVTN